MRVILLAAGFGTRLKPYTNHTPKCLMPINGIPLLQIWLDQLFKFNKNQDMEVLINTHYLSDIVIEFVGDSQYKNFIKLVHEVKLLGTAGTILANRNFIGSSPVMVVHADNLSRFDINKFMEAHNSRPHNCSMTMMLFRTDSPKSCGIVSLDNNGVVREFFEKVENPPSNLANAGIYIIEPSIIDWYLNNKPNVSDIATEIIPNQLGKIFTYINNVYHRDIGTPPKFKFG